MWRDHTPAPSFGSRPDGSAARFRVDAGNHHLWVSGTRDRTSGNDWHDSVDGNTHEVSLGNRSNNDFSAIAVIEVLQGRERKLTKEFLRLQSHDLFQEHFCLVRRPNEKGNVERLIGFARRNFLVPVPVPEVGVIETLNEQLRERCVADRTERTRGKTAMKEELIKEVQAAFLPLSKQTFEARRVDQRTTDSQSLIRFDDNDDSVPVQYAHRRLTVVATVSDVRWVFDDRLVAKHLRCGERERAFFEPIHYLALLERKPGGFDSARPLEKWELPECWGGLRRRLEAHDPRHGTRSYIQVLRLLEKFSLPPHSAAVEYALDIDVIDAASIRTRLIRRSGEVCSEPAKWPRNQRSGTAGSCVSCL